MLVAIGYAILLVVRAVGGSPTRDLGNRVTNLEGQVNALCEELRERDDE